MKFMSILTALSLSTLALAAPEVQGQRQLEVESVPNATSVSMNGTIVVELTTKVTSSFKEIESIGSEVLTIKGGGVGVITTFVPVVTEATVSVTGSRNAAVGNVRPLQISTPLLAALATTAGGVLFGAWVVL